MWRKYSTESLHYIPHPVNQVSPAYNTSLVSGHTHNVEMFLASQAYIVGNDDVFVM